MIIGIPKESLRGENRVAASPASVKALIKLGFDVQVQKGAGVKSSIADQDYADAGAKLATKKRFGSLMSFIKLMHQQKLKSIQ